jgi:hypothetical protein
LLTTFIGSGIKWHNTSILSINTEFQTTQVWAYLDNFFVGFLEMNVGAGNFHFLNGTIQSANITASFINIFMQTKVKNYLLVFTEIC